MMARDFAKQEKWTEAVTHLRTALSHVEKAMEKKSRVKMSSKGQRRLS